MHVSAGVRMLAGVQVALARAGVPVTLHEATTLVRRLGADLVGVVCEQLLQAIHAHGRRGAVDGEGGGGHGAAGGGPGWAPGSYGDGGGYGDAAGGALAAHGGYGSAREGPHGAWGDPQGRVGLGAMGGGAQGPVAAAGGQGQGGPGRAAALGVVPGVFSGPITAAVPEAKPAVDSRARGAATGPLAYGGAPREPAASPAMLPPGYGYARGGPYPSAAGYGQGADLGHGAYAEGRGGPALHSGLQALQPPNGPGMQPSGGGHALQGYGAGPGGAGLGTAHSRGYTDGWQQEGRPGNYPDFGRPIRPVEGAGGEGWQGGGGIGVREDEASLRELAAARQGSSGSLGGRGGGAGGEPGLRELQARGGERGGGPYAPQPSLGAGRAASSDLYDTPVPWPAAAPAPDRLHGTDAGPATPEGEARDVPDRLAHNGGGGFRGEGAGPSWGAAPPRTAWAEEGATMPSRSDAEQRLGHEQTGEAATGWSAQDLSELALGLVGAASFGQQAGPFPDAPHAVCPQHDLPQGVVLVLSVPNRPPQEPLVRRCTSAHAAHDLCKKVLQHGGARRWLACCCTPGYACAKTAHAWRAPWVCVCQNQAHPLLCQHMWLGQHTLLSAQAHLKTTAPKPTPCSVVTCGLDSTRCLRRPHL